MATADDRTSNVARFPVIGRHLVDERTPAYAPTEPVSTQPPLDDDAPADGPGSFDALGDDQAERHSGWGAMDEQDATPRPVVRYFLAAAALVALAAMPAISGCPMAWPLG